MSRPTLAVMVRNFAPEPPRSWAHVLEQARAADDAGIDRILTADHVVFGQRLGHYGDPARGGVAGGRQPTGPDGHWLEPLTTIAAMAAVTRRVRLATNVLLAALRRPVVLAKTVATLDVLSGGRFDLGVGVGWQEEEYDAAGMDFRTRGRALDETLAICQLLWTQPVVSYQSPHPGGPRLCDIHMMPKPVQASGVPIWVSGTTNRAVARRLARYGTGWLPWGRAVDAFVQERATMCALVEEHGRDFSTVRVAYPLRTYLDDRGHPDFPRIVEPVPELIRHGVTDFHSLVRLPHRYDQAVDLLADFVAAFRAVTE